MHVVITHGYLMQGTGSNLYVCNLARALCKSGCQVSIVCQEHTPEPFDFVSEHIIFKPDNVKLETVFKRETAQKLLY